MRAATETRNDSRRDTGEAIRLLLAEARPPESERRSWPREPFFGPVALVREEGGQTRSHACFSRDVSPEGMGLLHSEPFEPGPALLKVPLRRAGGEVELECEIVWCRPCGEGWYLIGTEFARPQHP